MSTETLLQALVNLSSPSPVLCNMECACRSACCSGDNLHVLLPLDTDMTGGTRAVVRPLPVSNSGKGTIDVKTVDASVPPLLGSILYNRQVTCSIKMKGEGRYLDACGIHTQLLLCSSDV